MSNANANVNKKVNKNPVFNKWVGATGSVLATAEKNSFLGSLPMVLLDRLAEGHVKFEGMNSDMRKDMVNGAFEVYIKRFNRPPSGAAQRKSEWHKIAGSAMGAQPKAAQGILARMYINGWRVNSGDIVRIARALDSQSTNVDATCPISVRSGVLKAAWAVCLDMKERKPAGEQPRPVTSEDGAKYIREWREGELVAIPASGAGKPETQEEAAPEEAAPEEAAPEEAAPEEAAPEEAAPEEAAPEEGAQEEAAHNALEAGASAGRVERNRGETACDASIAKAVATLHWTVNERESLKASAETVRNSIAVTATLVNHMSAYNDSDIEKRAKLSRLASQMLEIVAQ